MTAIYLLKECEEYAKLAIVESYFTPLLLDGPTFSVGIAKCKFDTPLIVGGEEAQLAEFPHMAAIGWNSTRNFGIEWGCGGVLISYDVVLTAAHCNLRCIKFLSILDEYKKLAFLYCLFLDKYPNM